VIREVEFHTGVEAPVAFACRLLRKAVRAGAALACTAEPAVLDELDRALWTFEERDFVPHVRMPGARPEVAARTPVWLCGGDPAPAAGRVLVNLGAGVPGQPEHFARLIEIVGAQEGLATAGRERWRHYRQLGLEVRHHGPARG
jgi:DNA polymerase-3 subunit chi